MATPELASLVDMLARFLGERAQARDERWAELDALVTGTPGPEPRLMFTLAPRLVGKGTAPFTSQELARVAWPVGQLAVDEVVRIVLLARAVDTLEPHVARELLDACYRHGEVREKVAVLRALPFLAMEHESLVAIAADACRSHVQPVFEAIACENPFPARHFEAGPFRQLVLKALFTEASLARVVGLAPRIDAELVRMVSAYIDERRAAGRSVPSDASWLVNQGTSP